MTKNEKKNQKIRRRNKTKYTRKFIQPLKWLVFFPQIMNLIKEGDSRATPEWIMMMFKDWFDPCPLNPNPEVDGLEIEWKDKTYCNPPYSQMSKWIFKAIEENKKGKTIALLIRFDPSTIAFKSLIERKVHLLYCGERLHFITPDNKTYASPFPSMIVILEGSATDNK